MINNQNLAVLSEKVAYLESAVKNSDEASEISYDNTESGLTADDVQSAIDEIVAGFNAPAASSVTYDNTDSGLTADDVQGAIDELNVKFIPLSKIIAGNDVEFGTFNVTSGTDNFPVTGIKVTTTTNDRYCIIGMVLSGSVKGNHFIAYTSWAGALVDLTAS